MAEVHSNVDLNKLGELKDKIAKTSLCLDGHMQDIYADLQRLMTTCEDERIDEFFAEFTQVRRPVEELIVDLAEMHKELTYLYDKYWELQNQPLP